VSGGKVRGSGVRRSQETAGHISRLARCEQPEFCEGGSEYKAAPPQSIIPPLPAGCSGTFSLR